VLSHYDRDDVRRAIVREGLSYLAHGVLWPLGRRRAAVPPAAGRETRTVVFVHGLGANRAGFLPLQTYLRALGHRWQYAVNIRRAGSVEALALQLRHDLRRAVRGGRIDLVAHSLGGLVSRYYLQQLGGARRVDRLITLGTPHGGTHAANFLPSRLVRQLLPDGPFIRHLNALPPPAGVQVTSLVAGRDLLVQPTEAARCPFGNARRFDDLGHVELLFRPTVFSEVARILGAPKS
jgi:pimeloyl-ACP methyl ester carboxylesterase